MAIDPVCKMEVNEDAAGKSEHGGKTYYFCAAACKKAFDADPSRYATQHRAARWADKRADLAGAVTSGRARSRPARNRRSGGAPTAGGQSAQSTGLTAPDSTSGGPPVRDEVAKLRAQSVALRIVIEHNPVVVESSNTTAVVYDEMTNNSFYVDPATKEPPEAAGTGEMLKDAFFLERSMDNGQ